MTVFQLDAAPPHFSNNVHAFLDGEFLDHWVGRGGPISWPSLSANVTSLDFFFLRFLKDIYHERVQNMNELHNKIVGDAECITNEMLANTW
jgi:hypothetical protein